MSVRRLFFALWPDDSQREALRNQIGPLIRQVEGRPVPRGNWHVTLAFIGSFPEPRIRELLAASRELRVEPFRLRFDRLAYWQRPRIASLQAVAVPAALERLVADLGDVMRRFDVEPEAATYRPHVTLVRAARPFEALVLARPLELTWSGFELVESRSLPDGVRYYPLKQELPANS
jgi:2'-5' RNA ligase